MAFNFKNNNLIIILLLILVIASSMSYLMMEKNVEGFALKGFQPTITNKFTNIGGVPNKLDRTYLILNESKRYVLNSKPYPSVISELESSGNFNFRNKVGKDLSYNAFLYQIAPAIFPATAISPATTNDISYDLYNLQLMETYDLSSRPVGTDATTEEKNKDLSGTTNILMVIDSSGYFYDVSGLNRKLGFNLILDKDYIIVNGELKGSIPTARGLSSSTAPTTGWHGNINFNDMFRGSGSGISGGYPRMTPELYTYMMQGGIGMSGFNTSLPYYSNFETAMNIPSNPVVNPLNSMNPVNYNEALFGPNITPTMANTNARNSLSNKATNISSKNNKDISKNPITNTFNELNSRTNTLLSQNTNDTNNNTNNNNNGIPPCPPCARCPESNYECKKVPAYEQGYENTALPRPVLSDFSTFGM